jgi:DNA-binding LacI/PurR family transcriptional regulator
LRNGEIPTLADVAERAGLSAATVSRVLNGVSNNEASRALVERAVRELGYRPNRMARSLRSRASHFVGVLIPDLGHGSYARMVKAAQDVLEAAEYQILIMSTHRDPDGDRRAVDAMIQNRVDGMLIASYGGLTAAPPVPTVFLDNFVDDANAGNVLPANAAGINTLFRHLLDVHAPEDIGYLGPNPRLSASTERFDSFLMARQKAGLPVDASCVLVADDEWSPQSASDAVRRAFHAGRLPNSLIAASDTLAVGAIHGLRSAGLSVPDDVSVVSFDDPLLGAYAQPSLTALRPVDTRMGTLAADLLLNTLKGSSTIENVELRVPLELVVRESCGCTEQQPEPDDA